MKITLSKKQWQLIGRKTGWIKKATGEPDQDYNHDAYDVITKLIKIKTGIDAFHKEFDKYQGVYVSVSGICKFWTIDSYVIGKQKKPTAKYRSATLVNSDGNQVSSNRGDYFMQKPETIFNDYTLTLLDFNGKETKIESPKISDLPDLLEVQRYIEYESEPDSVLVLQSDESMDEPLFNIRISFDNKIVSDGGLINYIKSKIK